MFKVMDIFIGVNVKVTHDNNVKSILNCGFNMVNNELAKSLAFCEVIVVLKTIIIDDFEFFVREIKVGGDKTAAVFVDFLDVFRNKVRED